MIYDANTTVWRVGDVVIHDADAKTSEMLMRVVRDGGGGLLVTRYIDDAISEEALRRWGTRDCVNALHVLHDPARFEIDVPWEIARPPRRRR